MSNRNVVHRKLREARFLRVGTDSPDVPRNAPVVRPGSLSRFSDPLVDYEVIEREKRSRGDVYGVNALVYSAVLREEFALSHLACLAQVESGEPLRSPDSIRNYREQS